MTKYVDLSSSNTNKTLYYKVYSNIALVLILHGLPMLLIALLIDIDFMIVLLNKKNIKKKTIFFSFFVFSEIVRFNILLTFANYIYIIQGLYWYNLF